MEPAWKGPMRTGEQTAAVLRLLETTFEDALAGAWLHGSAVLGSQRPTSDIDILAMVEVAPDQPQRRSLLRGLLEVSVHPEDTITGRPVELSVVVRSDVVPWRYPPTVTFQYGEWLRREYEDGVVPGAEVSSDLALLIEVARRADDSLVGPSPREVLPEVPPDDLRRAAVDGVPELLDHVGTDTRNVVLTLARIMTTLETGRSARRTERRTICSPASPPRTNRSSLPLGTTTSARERRTGRSVSTRLEPSPSGA